MIDLNRLAKPDKTIREHTDDLLSAAEKLRTYNYIDENHYFLLKKACEYHDYGKMNDEFQTRISSERKKKFDDSKEVPHNILSLAFINRDEFDTEEEYYKVCYAVLNHHQNVNNFKTFYEKRELIEKFNQQFQVKNFRSRDMNHLVEMKAEKDTQLLKGFLNRCDYAASGEFEIEYQNDFLESSMKNLGYIWNDLQKFCLENRDKNIIAIANTGMGKTEAGLLWIGNHKGFFILPLRTAINSIYKRVSENIVKNNIDERVALLHSDTLSYYLTEVVTEEEKVLKYSQRGKDFSIPLTISTLDQIFDFVYLYEGFELKLATLSYSKIVIDEIQAYSPDLLAYLIIGLEKVVSLGGKFAILTATLPPFIQNLIENITEEISFAKFTVGKDRHNVKVLEKKLDAEEIYNHYIERKGKTLVVCNTVKEAQRIYDELKKMGLENELSLLHAKFIKKDRLEKEKAIMKFGKTENVGDGIWISTSLVEASLDIDFDYLFTELNELNGFFQRLGRVNRKGVKSIEIPNAYLFTEIDSSLIIKSSDSKRGFIDIDIYQLSKEALLGIDGVLSEERKAQIIEEQMTTEKLAGSSFMKRYDTMKKYISSLYVGEFDKSEMRKRFRDIVSYAVIPLSVYEENRELIEEFAKIIREPFKKDPALSESENRELRDRDRIEKVKAKSELEQFTLGVTLYDLNRTGKKVELGYDSIDIINCEYTREKGFVRIKKERKQSDQDEDPFF